MTSDIPFSLPRHPRHAAKQDGAASAPLDGEVIPPRIRVVPPERESSASSAEPRSGFRVRLGTALLAIALSVTAGGGGALELYRWKMHQAHAAARTDGTAQVLARLQDNLGALKTSVDAVRQDDAVRALKKSVDLLKAEFDTLRGSNAAAVAQINAKLDKPMPAAPNLTDVVARIDKMEHDPHLADIAARLDRIERQVSSSTPTGSIVPQAKPVGAMSVATPASAAVSAKPSLKTAVLDNWIVRDVYSGVALVEGRSGGVREVVPGEFLPGAGEVRSIERRGRAWVVVTSRGIIDTETW